MTRSAGIPVWEKVLARSYVPGESLLVHHDADTAQGPLYSRLRTLPLFSYRLEPVVRLSSGDLVGAEVLRDGLKCLGRPGWRAWYGRVGRIQPAMAHDDSLLFINLHTEQILDGELMERLFSGITDPGRVVLEWTERACRKQDLVEAAGILKYFRSTYRVSIAVDDFGSGVDGIQRLTLVQADIVKIDGSLLHAARTVSPVRYLLRDVVRLIEDCGALPLAEWVEYESDVDVAREAGVEWAQGYLWSHTAGVV